MLASTFSINQPLRIEVDAGGRYLAGECRLEDVQPDILVTSHPVWDGAEPRLAKGQPVVVTVVHDTGIYQFATEVLGRASGPDPGLVLRRPSDFDRVQRRNDVRLPVDVPVQFFIVGDKLDAPPKNGRTLNISAGGALLVVEGSYERGTRLEIRFTLPNNDLPPLEGVVVRTVHAADAPVRVPQGRSMIGVRWDRVGEGARAKLARFIFQEQIRRHKLGID